MVNYKLLTPGPLTTTHSVKSEMMYDHCTWDNDYKQITQTVRNELLVLANASKERYTAVLMQGSGTFGVESVLTSIVGADEKLLILSNGAYGERMVDIANYSGIRHKVINFDYNESLSLKVIEDILDKDEEITHVAMVHCETTTGILNDMKSVVKLIKDRKKIFILDAMSSFGGVEIDVENLNIDYLISSSNKCIQGVPGFSFIICSKQDLEKCRGKARSLSLDIYEQWKAMEKDGKWRFTSPTHAVLAFSKALEELNYEGGVSARSRRYRENNELLNSKMNEIGIKSYVSKELQSPIITTFLYPENASFCFEDMYNYIKERGYAIYPGKLTDVDTFRIGNIGEIYLEDIEILCSIIKDYFTEIRFRGI